MVEDYRKALEVAQRELDELLTQQAQAEKRIAQLRLTINGLRALSEESGTLGTIQRLPGTLPASRPVEDMGITDTIREILKASQFPCTVGMVRDEMEDYGYDIDRYSNIMATISVILKRLVEKGEVKTTVLEDANDADKIYTGYLYIPTHNQRVRRLGPRPTTGDKMPTTQRKLGPRPKKK